MQGFYFLRHYTEVVKKLVYVCGPIKTLSLEGSRYFVVFINVYSRWCEAIFLKSKDAVLEAKQTEKSIKSLSIEIDNGVLNFVIKHLVSI